MLKVSIYYFVGFMYWKIIIIGFNILLFNLFNINKVSAQEQLSKPDLINVKEINIQGNTVFPDSEFDEIFDQIEGKSISLEDLLQTRDAVEKFYRDQGYISSGAFLPPQELKDGSVLIQVVEGSLAAIEIKELSSLRKKYITDRLPELEKPLKISELDKSLRILEENPLIREIEGELKLIEPGKNLLSLEIIENKPIQIQLNSTNTFSPSIGMFGGEFSVRNQNLFGFGDRLSANYTKTEGLDSFGVGYSIPFNTSGGEIAFSYDDADSELVEEIVSAFDIQSDFEAYKVEVRQPVYKNVTEELAFFVGLEKLNSETFVSEDISFPFVDGLEDGESRITPLRLGQEYTRRNKSGLIAAKSQFNLGLDIFDVTESDAGIKTSLSTQLSPDKLLPLEQLTVGGLGTVRGYRRNLIVGDNGVIGIVEGQFPIIRSSKWGNVYFIPFLDFGTVWNNSSDPSNTQSNTLVSTGLEINYRIRDLLEAKIFYGIPLTETEGFGNSSVEEKLGVSISVIPVRF